MDINGSASRFSGFRQCHRRRRVASGVGSEDADLLLGVGNQPRQCYRRTSIAFGPGSEHGDRLGIRKQPRQFDRRPRIALHVWFEYKQLSLGSGNQLRQFHRTWDVPGVGRMTSFRGEVLSGCGGGRLRD